jgi:hypothetical protein
MARLLIACACLLGPPHQPPPPAPLCSTVQECRSELADARRAIRWQRHARALLARHVRRVHEPTVRDAAELAARAVGVDAGAMLRVAECESHLDPWARNPSSGAAGPWQFLPSTWAATPFRRWSPTNPVAAALATALIVREQGWRQWVCQP